MIRRLLIPATLLVCLSCAHLPRITPQAGDPSPGFLKDGCNVFPQGKWQLLHSIRAEMPGGNHFMMTGLTVMSSRLRTIRSVIMTLEGFVLFDGEYDGHLIVHRSLPPFESPHFAEGLMADIRLIFFEPDGPLVGCGVLDNGAAICRHEIPDGGAIDIRSRENNGCELNRYSPSQRLTRTLTIQPGERHQSGLPQQMALTALGDQKYKIVMTLLEADRLEP